MADPSPARKKGPQFPPEWCRVALASIGDAVITTDIEGRVTFLNSVAESLTGQTLKDAAGQPLDSVFRLIGEASRQAVESPTIRALGEGKVGLANQNLLIAKDGADRLIDASAVPVRDEQGQVVGVVLVFRDVTERRHFEQQLHDALAYADSIIATLREPFVVLDNVLKVKTANAAFFRNFQVSQEETEGRFIYDLGNRQWDIPRLRELLEEVLPQNHSFQDYAVEHDFPTIGSRIMLLNARRFVSANSRPELILLAIQDITEHRRAEVAVRTSEVRYRRLFETAKDGILILDSDTGKILDANPFMTNMLGYAHDEFMGKELWEIGLFGDKSENEAAFRELQRNGYVRYDHLPLESKDGKRAEVEFVSNVYHVDHRHVAQCNIRDISERSRLERTTHEQAEALIDLHRRKDEFLAMLSHELRNPLAAISNAGQLLRYQKNEDQLQRKTRTIIERQVGQLTRLVDDLLEVSRITTGKIHLIQERLDLNGIVTNAVDAIRPLVGKHRHSLEVSLPLQPVWLNADPVRLEQVVVNLLTNASKYTDEGGHIWLSVLQEGDEAVLRVRDSGVGIAPELLPNIFDLFTQAERSLARSQGGLGVGLCLVQRLVEMHGGKVAVYSALGQGSEFVVRLPVMLTGEPQPPSSPAENAKPTGPSLRVLVVDDNVDVAESLAMLLEASGHDFRTAHDGPTALDAAVEYRPDIVLLDIGLPGMDGYQVAKKMRQQPNLKNVMLVAMSGYGHESDHWRSLEEGFGHHLVKPIDFGKLQQIFATIEAT